MRRDRRTHDRSYRGRDRTKDNGTPETAAKSRRVHQGSVARLFENGHLTIDQLAASQQIRTVAERIGRDVGMRSMSMETRVDANRRAGDIFFERLGAVRAEVAYGRWRGALRDMRKGKAVTDVVLDDLACRTAAKTHGMRDATLRRHLSDALDLWFELVGDVCKEIGEEEKAAAEARCA